MSGLDQACQGESQERTSKLAWAWKDELTNAAKYHGYTIELPPIDSDLDLLVSTEVPWGVQFDTYEQARKKADLINLKNNWECLIKTFLCRDCKRYHLSADCPCRDERKWLQDAVAKCGTVDDPDQISAALSQGFSIILECGAPEPIAFVHNDSCEFKWPEAVLYTFPNREPIYLLLKDSYVQASKDEFKVKFSG